MQANPVAMANCDVARFKKRVQVHQNVIIALTRPPHYGQNDDRI
jgi:hypothetical protein